VVKRTAIVTGAGSGLGRAYALDLARAGMRVVVNDRDGDRAKAVVAECRSARAEAEVDASAVGAKGAGELLIGRTVERFGRIDAFVANAGLVRDRAVHNLTGDEVDEVLSVHLIGVIDQVRELWPHFRRQHYGRLVLVSSAAGLFGNVGQANYAAAKAAVVGLARTLALEGRHSGIKVNVVAPIAQTDMAAAALGNRFAGLTPQQVAPLVTYLSSEICAVTGELFAAGGGRITRFRLAESRGVRLPQGFTASDVAQRINDICDMSSFAWPANVDDHLGPMLREMPAQ